VTLSKTRLFLLFLLVSFLLCALHSRSFSTVARWVPFGSAVSGAALCLLLMGVKEKAAESRQQGRGWSAVWTLLIVSGVVGLIGMLAMAPASFVVYMLLSERTGWRRVLIAAAVLTLAIYLTFGVVLQVPLFRELP